MTSTTLLSAPGDSSIGLVNANVTFSMTSFLSLMTLRLINRLYVWVVVTHEWGCTWVRVQWSPKEGAETSGVGAKGISDARAWKWTCVLPLQEQVESSFQPLALRVLLWIPYAFLKKWPNCLQIKSFTFVTFLEFPMHCWL